MDSLPPGNNKKSKDNNINNSKNKNYITQSTPAIQENIHARRIFSVDDDPDEVKHDIRYLEGLQDGLHYALHQKTSKPALNSIKSAPNVETVNNNNSSSSNNSNNPENIRPRLNPHRSISKGMTPLNTPNLSLGFDTNNSIIDELTENNNLGTDNNSDKFDMQSRGTLPDISVIHSNNEVIIEELNHTPNDLESNLSNNDDNDRISTTSSIESFTLRERQDAINKTHPFGIRIWKPALYKKQRSVQKAADEDIHETQLKQINWYVRISNMVWSMTIGLFLSIVFALAALGVAILGLFTPSAREYSLVFFKLAKYLFSPFGKVVYLLQDEHYLEEDRDEGISVPQFYKWVSSYSNRLFFHQSQSLSPRLNHNDRLQYPSYGSIPYPNPNGSTDNRTLPDTPISETPSLINLPNNNSRSNNNNNNNYNNNNNISNESNNSSSLDDNMQQRRYFGRGQWTIGRFIFYIMFHLVLEPIVMILVLITWLFVFTIPMSNILWNLLYHLRKHPLALGFKNIQNSSTNLDNANNGSTKNVLLCTFRCAGWHYYKFTVDGTNIIVVNLIFLVFFTIFDYYVLKSYLNLDFTFTNESTIFILCLASIIPLAFYIGQAVASISAQTSMGLGAVINAFFSTIVEIYLYCIALNKREGLLVEGSFIGSILGAVLLLPGLSMVGGAWNRKTQRYNPASAGVSSALLIFSMIVLFVPTIFYEIYGGYTVKCIKDNDAIIHDLSVKSAAMAVTSSQCYFMHPPLKHDRMYTQILQPMSISCVVVLFLAYTIGLWFTLRTHAKMIWELPITEQTKEITVGGSVVNNIIAEEVQDTSQEGHEAPNWSRSKSTCILLIATLLYATIAEILVACVDSVLEDFPGLSPKFLGLTIFALVPNTTEFLNAISFAIHGNVALSMEIGTAYALQVCQLQIPALVIYSIIYTWNIPHPDINIREQMFTLIFPKWDLIGCIGGIFMFTYLYAEGKSNYFKGSMLILMYVIIILGFFFQGVITEWSFDPQTSLLH